MTATLAAPARDTQGHGPLPAILHGISWQTYESLLQDLRSQRIFLTYDLGDLEIMAPLPTHERWTAVLRWLIEAVSDELNISSVTFGSTTFRREDLDRGLEPDCCYYVHHAPLVIGKEQIDLSKDPPPDLAIEVEITKRVIDREPIYAALGVPELWRFTRDRKLLIHLLQADGLYHQVERGLALPFIDSKPVSEFLSNLPIADDPTTRRVIRLWVQKTFATPS